MVTRRKKLIMWFYFTISIILIFIIWSIVDWFLFITWVSTNIINYLIWLLYLLSFWLTIYWIVLLIQNSTIEKINFSEKDIEYSWFWRRLLAAFIDGIIWYLIIPLFINLYYWFRDWQTIWYKAMWIKVYKINWNEIKSATWLQLFFYPFVKIVNTFTIGIWYLMIAFTQKKQWLHNIINSTVVIKTNKITSNSNSDNKIVNEKIEDNIEL